ncbi:MAG: helix-turn-helix transcriptional regulator [Collinsella sp.]
MYSIYIVGLKRPYIAEKLVISESTVKSHLQHIYTKCGVHSRQELISLVETTSKE